jgi:hypothetical protein
MSKPKKDEQPDSFVQVDAYGVKVKAPLGGKGKGGERPKDWKDVWKRVNGHLMRLAADCFGLAADVVDTARRLAQSIGKFASGASKVPDALAKRIEKGQQKADVREEKRQLAASDPKSQDKALPSSVDAREGLHAALERIQAKGGCAVIVEVKDMLQAIVAVKEEQLAETVATLQAMWGDEAIVKVYDKSGMFVAVVRDTAKLHEVVFSEKPELKGTKRKKKK